MGSIYEVKVKSFSEMLCCMRLLPSCWLQHPHHYLLGVLLKKSVYGGFISVSHE